jgi:hypothetical protein
VKEYTTMKTLILAATLAVLGFGAINAANADTACRWIGQTWHCYSY